MTPDDILALLAPAHRPLVDPITGAAPAGADPADDPAFHAVQDEINKLGGLHAAGVDWRAVRDGAADLLARRAKDVRLATWWAVASAHLASWGGLRDGLAVLALLAERHGEGMFPARPNARRNQWLWLSEQATRAFATAPDPDDPSTLAACLRLARALAEVLARQPGARDAPLARLVGLLEQRAPSAGDEGDGRTTTPPPEPAVDDARPLHEAPAPRPGSSLPDVAASLAALARARRERDPADESAYRLLRAAVYLREARFPRAPDVRTAEAPPPAELGERLRNLARDEDWLGLVRHAEAALERHPWWLDLHRWTALGLERAGGLFHAARVVVGREASHLVARVPALATLAFADGTPFASDDARAWLRAERLRHLGAALPGDRFDVAHEAELALQSQAARDLAAGGQPVEGLRLAMALAGRGADPRDRFQLRLAAARLALDHRLLTAARTLLDALVGEADALKLDAWEPALCARVYEALLECAVAQGAGRDKKLHERLYRIDPAAAVRFDDAK